MSLSYETEEKLVKLIEEEVESRRLLEIIDTLTSGWEDMAALMNRLRECADRPEDMDYLITYLFSVLIAEGRVAARIPVVFNSEGDEILEDIDAGLRFVMNEENTLSTKVEDDRMSAWIELYIKPEG